MSAASAATERSQDGRFDEAGRPKGWLSPTNKRRWANFKANRRGYWSLWIFMVLFIATASESRRVTGEIRTKPDVDQGALITMFIAPQFRNLLFFRGNLLLFPLME